MDYRPLRLPPTGSPPDPARDAPPGRTYGPRSDTEPVPFRPFVPPPPPVEEPIWLNPFLLGGALLTVVAVALVLLLLPGPDDPDDLSTDEIAALIAEPPRPPDLSALETPMEPADLRLTTDPVGAVVRMNGAWVGTAPLRLEDLRSGFYDLSIAAPAFAAKDTSVYLASGSVQHLVISLDAIDETGALGSETGDARTAPSLPRQRLAQRGSAGGGATPSRPREPAPRPPPTASPAPGEPEPRFNRATPDEVRQVMHTGSISITSNPPGAIVLVDGVPFGRAPLALSDLRPGSYVVTLALPGHVPLSYQAVVAAQSVAVVKGHFTVPTER